MDWSYSLDISSILTACRTPDQRADRCAASRPGGPVQPGNRHVDCTDGRGRRRADGFDGGHPRGRGNRKDLRTFSSAVTSRLATALKVGLMHPSETAQHPSESCGLPWFPSQAACMSLAVITDIQAACIDIDIDITSQARDWRKAAEGSACSAWNGNRVLSAAHVLPLRRSRHTL